MTREFNFTGKYVYAPTDFTLSNNVAVFDWDKTFAPCKEYNDKRKYVFPYTLEVPHKSMVKITKKYLRDKWSVVIVTGRPANCLLRLQELLTDAKLLDKVAIICRPSGSRIPNIEIKMSVLKRLIDGGTIIHHYEDDEEVLKKGKELFGDKYFPFLCCDGITNVHNN